MSTIRLKVEKTTKVTLLTSNNEIFIVRPGDEVRIHLEQKVETKAVLVLFEEVDESLVRANEEFRREFYRV